MTARHALRRPRLEGKDHVVENVAAPLPDKSFAAGVNRDIIEKGAEMLGIELSELINDVIMGMREVADEIGLRGNPDVSE